MKRPEKRKYPGSIRLERDLVEKSGPFNITPSVQLPPAVSIIASATYGATQELVSTFDSETKRLYPSENFISLKELKQQTLDGFCTAYACPETQVILELVAKFIAQDDTFRIYTGSGYSPKNVPGFCDSEQKVIFLGSVTPPNSLEGEEYYIPLTENGRKPGFLQNIIHECGHLVADITFKHNMQVHPALKQEFLKIFKQEKKNLFSISSKSDDNDVSKENKHSPDLQNKTPLNPEKITKDILRGHVMCVMVRNNPLFYSPKNMPAEHIARIGESVFLADYCDKQNNDKNRTLFKYCTEELLPRSFAFYRDKLIPAYQHWIEISDKIPQIHSIATTIADTFTDEVSKQNIKPSKTITLENIYKRVCNAVERGLVNNITTKQLESILANQDYKNKLIEHITGYLTSGIDKTNAGDLGELIDKGKKPEQKVKLITHIPNEIATFVKLHTKESTEKAHTPNDSTTTQTNDVKPKWLEEILSPQHDHKKTNQNNLFPDK